MPFFTVLVNWLLENKRPANSTLLAIAIAFTGVLLVVTRGELTTLFVDSTYGDVLILIGSIAWVLYTRSASQFCNWSTLRFTTLSTLAGTFSIIIITGTLTVFGIAQVPQISLLPKLAGHIFYIVGLASIVGVLFWNQGVRIMGSLNGTLFISLVPVSALVIGIAYGNRLYLSEVVGVMLIMLALLANNLFMRRKPQTGLV